MNFKVTNTKHQLIIITVDDHFVHLEPHVQHTLPSSAITAEVRALHVLGYLAIFPSPSTLDNTLRNLDDTQDVDPNNNDFLQYNAVLGLWKPATGTPAVSSPLTTKGDLYTFDTSDTRIGVGINGQVLAADSANPTGLKWVEPSGGVTDHTLLTNIGVNTHTEIDTHIVDGTVHFTVSSINHNSILNIGVNSHGVIDLHLSDNSRHFLQTDIDHVNLLNIGTNTHPQVDTHIADNSVHFTEQDIQIIESQVIDLQNYLLDITGELLTQLVDVPNSYSGQASNLLAVNGAETGTVFTNVLDGGGV